MKYKLSKTGKMFFGSIIAILLLVVMIVRGTELHNNYQYSDTVEYVVEYGDTLWNIAEQFSDGRQDTRAVVDEIEKLSNCTANIQPGQKLTIPVYEVRKK